MLTQALIFLGVAVVAVPIFQRLGLGTVLGYLAAGVAVGPSVLGLVDDPKTTLAIGEFGVVFMLFVIGLELEPRRLWDMRVAVFGVGSVQVFTTAALIVPIGLGVAGLPLPEAVMVALCLALSSTVLGLKLLNDRNERATPHGRTAFGILLFQDIAAIPIIAFAPLLGTTTEGSPELDAPSSPRSSSAWSSPAASSYAPSSASCRWRAATRSRRPRPSSSSSAPPS